MPEIDLKIYLKGDELESKESYSTVIISPHRVEKVMRNGKEENVDTFDVDIKGIGIRAWSPNRSTMVKLGRRYGLQTDDWVGKIIRLYSEDRDVFGKMKKCIYIEDLPTNGKKKK